MTRRWLLGGAAAVLAAVTASGVVLAAPDPVAAAVTTVYMAPPGKGGSDANNGMTPGAPVVTLNRVHQVLSAARPTTDVEVRIQQGVYEVAPMENWHFYVPGHTVSFLPVDYSYGEGADGIAGRPVFRAKKNTDGTYQPGYWLLARPAHEGEPLFGGGTSGLRFYYLQVERFSSGAISLHGNDGDNLDENYDPPLSRKATKGLNGNTFTGLYLKNLGSKWSGGSRYGWGAIQFDNSSNNVITNNTFVAVENSGERAPLIHGVYGGHFSNENQVTKNTFSYVSGDPVKFRDRSSFNNVEANTFTRTGVKGFFTDEFCDLACTAAYDNFRECAGYHNRFVHNRLVSGYQGETALPEVYLHPGPQTNAGEPPCAMPAGERRVYNGGNTRG